MRDAPAVGGLFGSGQRTAVKKELVILIKPTVMGSEQDAAASLRDARERILGKGPAQGAPGGAVR